MKELYVPFTIPNLESIQQELLAAIDHDYKESATPHAFTYSEPYMMARCPQFMSWLKPRLRLPVRIYRYYVTPPRQSLGIHIDGADPTVPFGINIPVTGTKNTYHSYYETDPDNLEVRVPDGYLGGTHPIDISKLTMTHELEIMRPYVINNEVLHGVRNDSDDYRVMFTVRWVIHKFLARNIEDCMNTSDLQLGVE